jgi:methylthioribose-1-phosphate isomerase
VSHLSGCLEGSRVEIVTVAPGTPISNIAFDVTPARLVTGLITELGVCEASEAGLAGLFPERALRAS